MRANRVMWQGFAGVLAIFAGGCHRPLQSGAAAPSLQETVAQAIAREMQGLDSTAASAPQPAEPPQSQPHDILAELAPRRAELEAIGPIGAGSHPNIDLGTDLTGSQQNAVDLTLNAAVQAAVNHNLTIQQSRLQPQISAEQEIAAESVFDAVLFANTDLAWTDEPQRVPVLMGIPLGTRFNHNQSYRFETGLRKRFSPGTQVSISTDLTRLNNLSPGITFSPDPGYTAAVRFGVDQPLLRGFGPDVNTATIRIQKNQTQRTFQQLQSDLLELVAQTEAAYWDLDSAWRQLAISQWLVEQGVQVRDVMERRREVDTKPAQYADAVARVEQRNADVIRAQRQVRAASDALKLLMNDPQIPVSSEAALRPVDEPIEAQIGYDLREAILTAADERPEVRQAALNIDDASIRQSVSNNQRLPLLNVSAQAAFYGLDKGIGGAYSEANDADFIDYLLGLAFELPIGNREAEADYRAARLQRSAATLNYQRTVQQVVLDVKNALRDVMTNWKLIHATRSFRIAQAENLRALQVQEEFLTGLTPEFLNLKFTQQERLAQARSQEVQALADFNKSIAALYRAMGIGLKMRKINVEAVQE